MKLKLTLLFVWLQTVYYFHSILQLQIYNFYANTGKQEKWKKSLNKQSGKKETSIIKIFDKFSNLYFLRIPYLALAKTLENIEAISGRNDIIKTLSEFFVAAIRLSPNDLNPAVHLCVNKLGPDYEGLELGIAESHLMKALAASTGRTV